MSRPHLTEHSVDGRDEDHHECMQVGIKHYECSILHTNLPVRNMCVVMTRFYSHKVFRRVLSEIGIRNKYFAGH